MLVYVYKDGYLYGFACIYKYVLSHIQYASDNFDIYKYISFCIYLHKYRYIFAYKDKHINRYRYEE